MKKLVLGLIGISIGCMVYGQSSHYWTETYGTRSMLLNGVVIGSVEDLGAVYYNPARLSQFESPAFVVAGQVYQLSGVKLRNALGDGIDLKNTKFGGGPSLVSGTFEVGFLKKSKFAYAFLTRARMNNNFTYSADDYGEYVKQYPGLEHFSGKVTSTSELSDEWIGLSWSHPLSEKWSVGVTGFYSNLARNAGLRLQLQAYSDSLARTGVVVEQRSYNYSSQSILGKFGLSYVNDRVTAGLVVTTPKLEGLGSASTRYETIYAGIDSLRGEPVEDTYILSNQSDLEQTHKTPWAVGLGAGIRIGNRSLLHLSAEWFSAIPEYTLLEGTPFNGQSNNVSDSVYNIEVINELGSVFNYGVGLEVYINEHFSLFGSYATDFSAVQTIPEPISDLSDMISDNNLRADKHHLGFGTDIKTNFADLTLGAMYGFSKETVKRNITIDEGQDAVTENVEVLFSRWRFLVGFQFHFVDKLREKIENKKK